MLRSHVHLRRWVFLAVVLAAVAGVVAVVRLKPTPVTVEPVARGRAVEAIYATGSVEPIEKVAVKARVAQQVSAIYVAEGDRVQAGQVLARIESSVRDLALSRAKTELAKAREQAGRRSPQLAALEAQVRALRAELDVARIELGRTERLVAQEAIAIAELDAARSKVAQLEAKIEAARAQVRSTRVELGATAEQLAAQVESLASEAGETTVRAPIAGVVLTKQVDPGEAVGVNQTLFELADDRDLRIELKVDEADIARVHEGPHPSVVALSFFAFPGRAFAGTVDRILPGPDRERRSYTVKVRLDAPISGLRVGMTAEANIVVQRKDNVLLIPSEAVEGNLAWFAEHGHAVVRPVLIGIADLTRSEVIGGAPEGALAIIDAKAKHLVPGQRIKATVRR